MSDAPPPPVCTCGHQQGFHVSGACNGIVVTGYPTRPCPCPGWTPKPDATTDPFTRGF